MNFIFVERLAIGLGCLALTFAISARADVVGTTGAVNTTTGLAPGAGAEKVIEIGAQVVRNERITTSKSGSMQVMFIDKTSLNIGPDSVVIVDQYVCNPADRTGSMALRLGKGVLRIVGGQVTHTGGATIDTPTASMGIRGGAATISYCTGAHCRTEGTRAILHFGRMTVASAGLGGHPDSIQEILRPGFAVTVGAANAPPGAIVRASSSEIGNLNTNLTSKPAQTGGTVNIPSDTGASRMGVGNVSNVDPGNVASRQTQNTTGSVGGSQSAGSASAVQTVQTAQSTAQQAFQNVTNSALAKTAGANGPTPPANPVLPQAPAPTVTAFALTTTVDPNLGQTTVPFLTASMIASGGTTTVTPIYGSRSSASNSSNLLQANTVVTGNGPTQTSTISLMTAQIANDSTYGPTMAGVVLGVGQFPCGNGQSCGGMPYGLPLASRPSSITLGADGLPTGSFPVSNENSFSFATHNYTPTNIPASVSNYAFTQTFSAAAAPADLGSYRPDVQLTGYAANVMKTSRSIPDTSMGNNFLRGVSYTDAYIVAGASSVTLVGSANRMGATFDLSRFGPGSATAYSGGGSDPILLANMPTTLSLRYGSAPTTSATSSGGTDPANSVYVDYARFGAMSEASIDPATGVGSSTSSINGRVLNGQPLSGTIFPEMHFGFMLPADLVGANTTAFLSSISSGTVTPCACDYTKWGFWTAFIQQADVSTNSLYTSSAGLGTWVAGVAAKPVDLPVTGTATYVGQTVASISNPNALNGLVGGASYLAAGTFTNTVNFGTRTGLVSINNLDNTNYVGTVSILANTTSFSGVLAGSTGGRSMTLGGGFYQGGPTNISPKFGEMGGVVGITGANSYTGAGTFTARRVN